MFVVRRRGSTLRTLLRLLFPSASIEVDEEELSPELQSLLRRALPRYSLLIGKVSPLVEKVHVKRWVFHPLLSLYLRDHPLMVNIMPSDEEHGTVTLAARIDMLPDIVYVEEEPNLKLIIQPGLLSRGKNVLSSWVKFLERNAPEAYTPWREIYRFVQELLLPDLDRHSVELSLPLTTSRFFLRADVKPSYTQRPATVRAPSLERRLHGLGIENVYVTYSLENPPRRFTTSSVVRDVMERLSSLGLRGALQLFYGLDQRFKRAFIYYPQIGTTIEVIRGKHGHSVLIEHNVTPGVGTVGQTIESAFGYIDVGREYVPVSVFMRVFSDRESPVEKRWRDVWEALDVELSTKPNR